MSTAQRWLFALGLIICFAMLLYPPWVKTHTETESWQEPRQKMEDWIQLWQTPQMKDMLSKLSAQQREALLMETIEKAPQLTRTKTTVVVDDAAYAPIWPADVPWLSNWLGGRSRAYHELAIWQLVVPLAAVMTLFAALALLLGRKPK